jgi:hypothetical protein
MKQSLLTTLLAWFVLSMNAQTYPPKDAPQLEFALQLKVTLGEAYGINNTQHGRRTVIPITGGTFEGPGLKGTIINGKDADGKPTFYFRAAPQFEAPADSPYGWLNNALFVCAPEWSKDFQGIVLNVWKVK